MARAKKIRAAAPENKLCTTLRGSCGLPRSILAQDEVSSEEYRSLAAHMFRSKSQITGPTNSADAACWLHKQEDLTDQQPLPLAIAAQDAKETRLTSGEILSGTHTACQLKNGLAWSRDSISR